MRPNVSPHWVDSVKASLEAKLSRSNAQSFTSPRAMAMGQREELLYSDRRRGIQTDDASIISDKDSVSRDDDVAGREASITTQSTMNNNAEHRQRRSQFPAAAQQQSPVGAQTYDSQINLERISVKFS
mmetsp:Transcript_27885/g.37242  ORF Transcript_27885/g.37242 Transcript_27885/m.37242 type:complete len:128 (-) Transcript_27885:383-766(-)|eukprot:CAMPEP_0185575002 /NCGR_PEP_ID=MMETSP0434-20130131/6315_1 /TAXON_ID=626734 ORGANISM="Favella taraikaensis, Strain Fe Narragansett Bay" /NCGR_SAMPLE_ID=MMETSP0434 /ASSEMBLY_ACC=CAM_ASM_000379 /LENGTH=127 /DNA_ID=CAMNT_0028191755 /DNA_START=1683 /DNA_END=2066 /DNA_ORIENTATION=+